MNPDDKRTMQGYLNAIQTYAWCIANQNFCGRDGIERAAYDMNRKRKRVELLTRLRAAES